MIYLRSFLFNFVWYINLIVQLVVQAPFYFFMSYKQANQVPKRWGHSSHFFHRILVGTDYEILGQENIPDEGCIVASKHQSLWEFYAVNAMVPDTAFILKAELMKIPFFGWFIAKLRHIPINRGNKGAAMRRMIKVAKDRIAEGRQIVIFPEGTRKAPGEEPNYRYGVTRMYLDLNCPVYPVALNSGLYWPRRKFIRHPGTIRIMFMKPIMPGLSGDAFSAELEKRIEEGCDELYRLALNDDVSPPINAAVQARIDQAGLRLNHESK